VTREQAKNEALQVYERLTSALDRMYGIVPLAETSKLYDAIRKGEIAEWLPAQLHSGREAVQMTARRAAEEAISINDGTPLLQRSTLQQVQEEAACGYLLSFGTRVEIVEPRDLREKVMRLAESVAAFYAQKA
jgi:predicted DNA-binding transcriptional regulator YafY